ncbi:hypothetical protein AN946_01100 [Trueperella pyogenes]|nr:hypothetical protein AN946_01100 [Trueperella pyogenes]
MPVQFHEIADSIQRYPANKSVLLFSWRFLKLPSIAAEAVIIIDAKKIFQLAQVGNNKAALN